MEPLPNCFRHRFYLSVWSSSALRWFTKHSIRKEWDMQIYVWVELFNSYVNLLTTRSLTIMLRGAWWMKSKLYWLYWRTKRISEVKIRVWIFTRNRNFYNDMKATYLDTKQVQDCVKRASPRTQREKKSRFKTGKNQGKRELLKEHNGNWGT